MRKYDPKSIEPKWQQIWADTKLYAAKDGDSRPKYYMLTEFPYPSGDGLHAGHAREYTLGDVIARHKRMQGYNVLYPMGYDAFGLPTENFAIKHKMRPQDATAQNVANFRQQFESLGYSFDWDRQVNTTDPSYYKWTQWLFLQFLQAGLAYQAEMPINWCPKCKTGLANEEVVDGKHERCGTPVEKKLLKQWMLKITAYADRLIEGLKTVDYPPRIADQQINWIGRSEGAEITFKLRQVPGQADDKHWVTVYTTRPDTLMGATFIVISPETAKFWMDIQWQAPAEVKAYVTQALAESELSRQEDRQKTGVDTGLKAVHPVTGELLPVWVADYVLGSYGTGAIMAVPAHDERDGEFARTFDLPIKTVVEPVTGTPQADPEHRRSIVALVRHPRDGKLLSINWGPQQGGHLFIGGGAEAGEDLETTARREVAEETGYQDLKLVARSERVHHHYFAHSKGKARQIEATGFLFELASDQRAATRLEADEQDKFKVEWLSAEQAERAVSDELHQYLFQKFIKGAAYTGYGPLTNSGRFDGLAGTEAKRAVTQYLFDQGSGKGATKYRLRDWIFSRQHYWGEPIPVVHCNKDGIVPVPADQLPVTLPEVNSYEPTDTGESPLAAITDWVNTTCPKCGGPAKRETDTMPNWAGSSWYYLRYPDARNDQAFADPAKLAYWLPIDLYLGGMEHTTLHLLYSRFWHQFLYDRGLVPTPEPYAARRGQGIVLASDGRKMSKSIGNVINPNDVIARYGADAFRLYILFMAPYDESTAWSDERLNGVSRFVYRVFSLAQELIANRTATTGAGQENTGEMTAAVDRMSHQTIKRVHDQLHDMKFNTMVAALMEYVNFLASAKVKAALIQPRYAALAQRTVRTLVLLLAPATPHLAEELWHDLGEQGSVHVAAWPEYDPELLKEDLVTIVVQVNGKLRGQLIAAVDATSEELTRLAQADPNVAKHLAGSHLVKTVVVPRKLVNFVVKPQ